MGSTETLTATVAPDNATDKTVKWSVDGADAGAVKLYTDESCATEVSTDATETLTVYAKGASAGGATVTCTSNADSTKSASCAVTVNEAAATPAAVTANDRDYDGTEQALVTVTGEATGGEMQYALGENAADAPESGWDAAIPTAKNIGTYYVWYKCAGDETHLDSDAACVTVTVTLPDGSAPVITVQPQNVTVNENKRATLEIVAEDATSYQWYYKTTTGTTWKKISRGTKATLKPWGLLRYNGIQFRCTVANDYGEAVSEAAVLTVNPRPVITTQPQDVTVQKNKRATLEVVAQGATSYQWYCKTATETTWKKIRKGTEATLEFKALESYNGVQFVCRVSNEYAAVNTVPVTLTVE